MYWGDDPWWCQKRRGSHSGHCEKLLKRSSRWPWKVPTSHFFGNMYCENDECIIARLNSCTWPISSISSFTFIFQLWKVMCQLSILRLSTIQGFFLWPPFVRRQSSLTRKWRSFMWLKTANLQAPNVEPPVPLLAEYMSFGWFQVVARNHY